MCENVYKDGDAEQDRTSGCRHREEVNSEDNSAQEDISKYCKIDMGETEYSTVIII